MIRTAGLVFSLELPPGLFQDEDDGAGPQVGRRLAVFRSIAEGPALAVRCWRLETGVSVCDALLAVATQAQVAEAREARAGGPNRSHAGLAWREEGGGWVRSRFALECDGAVVLATAEAPADLWDDYGSFAERAMMTIEILDPSGPPTAPLRPGEDPPAEGGPLADPRAEEAEAHTRALRAAADVAGAMIARGDDQGAVRHVQAVDGDIRGSSLLARLFEAALAQARDPGRADELYALARDWGWRSIPSPQTAVEGEQHAEALAGLEARLADIRGRGPV